MNSDLQNLTPKVEDGGTTPQGRLTASEWNILLEAVKSLDLAGGSTDAASILQVVIDAGYATKEWVKEQGYVTSLNIESLTKNIVTLDTTQAITGIKDFANGLKIGGLSAYKSQDDTIYLDCNLVVRGGVTAFGTNETITASLFEALPIDGKTIKRNPETNELFVDVSVIGGGGIDEEQLEAYLTANAYATQSWVENQKYITASALNGYATEGWVLSQKYLTGISSSMVIDALGYTPYNSANFAKANIKSTLGISDWALASVKPTYTASEVGAYIGNGSSIPNGEDLANLQAGSYWVYENLGAASAVKLSYSSLVVLGNSYYSPQMNISHNAKQAYIRGVYNADSGNSVSDWHELAFTDTNTLSPSSGTLSIAGNLLATGGKFTDNVSIAEGRNIMMRSANTDYLSGIGYDTKGNECLALWAKKSVTRLRWKAGIDLSAGVAPGAMMDITPDFEISKASGEATGYIAGRTILHSGNYSDILAGGTINGSIAATSFIGTLTTSEDILFNTEKYNNIPFARGLVWRNDASEYANCCYVTLGGPYINITHGRYNETLGLRILDGGNVAIGGITASEKLHVHGNILATGGVTAQNSSDRRLKRNIRKFNASEVLMSLGGVWEYEYIDSEVERNHIYEGTHYGLIYQNVKGTTLDVMCHKREDGFGTLNYHHQKFISLVAGATMENITEVGKLKRKIRHLEAKVKQLENRA